MGAGIATKVVTSAIGFAGNYSSYKANREQGDGFAKAVGKLAIESALWANPLTQPVMMGIMGAQLVKGGMEAVVEYGKNGGNLAAKQVNNVYKNGAGYVGGNFIDTNNASTMRQRGLQAMEHSGYNVRSVLGSEARTFYQRY